MENMSRPILSARELDILKLVAEGKSNKEIAAITLTPTRNVETQRLNLRKKLKLKTGQDLKENLGQILQ